MLIEKSTQSEITSLPTGEIQIKTVNTVEKDGEILSSKVHYDVLQPGSDVSTHSVAVQKVAQATWTPEAIAPFTAQVTQAIQEQATAIAKLEAETEAHKVAQAAAEKAKAEAAIAGATP